MKIDTDQQMRNHKAGRADCQTMTENDIRIRGLKKALITAQQYIRRCEACPASMDDYRVAGWVLELRLFVDRHADQQTFNLDVPYEKQV